ncbi:endonuclease Q family protein [Geodermatophilus sp. DSM 44513]|uniref:endonuclease Q family protein n=1 Tax=Geodermatophilus sp. DSM 44513 TaxID=1528104 RepID=UPI001277C4F3|nr:endonuclease Q family protein [Geodermatophilus sp. DSM 44513]WNV76159.1 endonuclease Q family protein [Geodermatophilus sp. DSM 44513]
MTAATYSADLHVHSRFAYATSRDLTLPVLDATAREKGVRVLGTGDCTHPVWFEELRSQLVPAPEEGLYVRRDAAGDAATRFLPSVEVSCVSRQGGRARRVHVLVLLPSLQAVSVLNGVLAQRGADLETDGRPTLRMGARAVTELALQADPTALVVPAHVWTPWFGALGSRSGFDSLAGCFEDLTPHVLAAETGLSADPAMCWRVSSLDAVALLSGSDAHGPRTLGRELTCLEGELSYPGIREALRTGAPARAGERPAAVTRLAGTIEFHPAEGKYHLDGHRAHDVRMTPAERAAAGGRCPVCGEPVTVGVLSRVEELADRPVGARPEGAPAARSLVPLDEVLAAALGVRPAAKRVAAARARLLQAFGDELSVLTGVPLDDLAARSGARVAEGVARVRAGEVTVDPGYDGRYGAVRIFPADDAPRARCGPASEEEAALF